VDILVNNAGIGVPGTILNTSEEDWDRIFAVNVKGIFQCSRFAVPQMIANGGGSIVNMSSIVAFTAVVDRAAYGASKGAVLALTKAMAADHVKDNIRVNCVCPGTIDTPWVGRMVQNYPDPAEARQKMVNRQPIGRLGTAEEIAEAVLYLAAPSSGFTTGSAMIVDGGFSAFKLPA
jgi:NAD(P)-dependent dehydrogenase (short-subunit alcohol dehydrogenase family)